MKIAFNTCSLHTIGVSKEHDAMLMNELNSVTEDGTYCFAEDPAEIKEAV